jgi:hypothetical protein
VQGPGFNHQNLKEERKGKGRERKGKEGKGRSLFPCLLNYIRTLFSLVPCPVIPMTPSLDFITSLRTSPQTSDK